MAANALLGVPIPYAFPSTPAADSGFPASNLTNDEPGLVWRKTGGGFSIDVDLTGTDDLGLFAVLGSKNLSSVTLNGYTSSANRTAGTPKAYTGSAITVPLSTNSSAPAANGRKGVVVLSAPSSARYWTITIDGSGLLEAWRFLFMKKIQPPDNIEVGAAFGIDDRSERRYSRSGRQNIDPVGIYPTFQGAWPWIEQDQWRADFRPLMLKKGATYPVFFCMDYTETAWGEDETIYGNLEKQQQGSYEDGLLYSFSFAIVGIAQ